MREEGIFPYCAMVQVAATDTHEDYVICRGFDPRIRKFIDYAAGDPDNPGISVAKPYGNRTTSSYQVGEVYPAFLPTQGTEDYVPPSPTDVDWRVGQNSGTASPSATGGQPVDLDSAITGLTDDNGVQVQWMLIDSGGGGEAEWFRAKENWTSNYTDDQAAHYVVCHPCDDYRGANTDTGTDVTIRLPSGGEQTNPRIGHRQDPNVVEGDVVAAVMAEDGSYTCVSDYLDDKVGTVKMWSLQSIAVREGWNVMDGVQNAPPNGNGINMSDQFVRGSASFAGSRGGFNEHFHDIDVVVENHTGFALGLAIQQVAGIFDVTVPEHSVADLVHYHELPPDSISLGWESLSVTWNGAAHAEWTEDQKGTLECSGIPEQDSDCLGADWGPLTHEPAVVAINPGAGGAAGGAVLSHSTAESSVEGAAHIPPYVTLIFIERFDNSV